MTFISKTRILLLAAILVLPFTSRAQHKLDSLIKAESDIKSDTALLRHWARCSQAYVDEGIYDSAFMYTLMVIRRCEELEADSGTVITEVERSKIAAAHGFSYRQLSYMELITGDLSRAMEFGLKALEICERTGDKFEMARSYTNLGVISMRQNNRTDALGYYEKSLTLRIQINDHRGVGSAYNSMANLYLIELSELFEAYTAKAIKHVNGINVVGDTSDATFKIRKWRLFSLTNMYYDSAEATCKRVQDHFTLSDVYNNRGAMYFTIAEAFLNLNGPEDSIKYYNGLAMPLLRAGLEMREKARRKAGISGSYINIGSVFAINGEGDSARYYLNKGLKLAVELGHHQWIANAYYELSKLSSREGNYKEAYDLIILHHLYQDSVANSELLDKAASLKNSYYFDRQLRQVEAEQQLKDVIAAEEIKQQTRQRNYFIGGFCFMLLFAGVIFYGFRQKKKSEELLEKKNAQIEEKQKEILDSITYAQRLQRAILTTPDEISKHIPGNFLLYKPKDIVAGDFYFFETTSSHIFIAAADCTGHGVPGAMVSIVCSNALTRCVKEFQLSDPGKILDKARELVVETFEKSGQDVKDGMDISFLAIDRSSKELKWAGANNPLWIVGQFERSEVLDVSGANLLTFQLSDLALLEIKGDKQPIGKTENSKPFTTHEVSGLTSQVSCLYLFTDGFADQFGGPKGKKFKYKQLQELLIANAGKSLAEQQQILENAFEEWKGNLEQVDDVCVIGLKL